MRESRLWQHSVIALLTCAVVAFGRTDEASSPVPLVDAHASIDCAFCHSLVASLDDEAGVTPMEGRCRTCHAASQESKNGISAAFHGDESRACGECHFFHEPTAILAGGRAFVPDRSGKPGPCSACHNQDEKMGFLSQGHLLAADLYHSNLPDLVGLSASESCLLCHAEEGTPPVAGLELTSVPRFDSHRMHPVGPIEQGGDLVGDGRIRRNIDPRLRLFDNRIECHTCHQLTSLSRNRLVDMGSSEALCLGCHEFE